MIDLGGTRLVVRGMQGVLGRCERIAQLMGEHREKLTAIDYSPAVSMLSGRRITRLAASHMWDKSYNERRATASLQYEPISACFARLQDASPVPPPNILRSPTAAKALLLIALLAIGCLLYFAQVAFIPVALALFLSSLLSPAVDLLHRWHLPRGLGAILVVAIVLLAGAAAVDAVWSPAKAWLGQAPQTLEKIERQARPVQRFLGKFDVVTEKAGQLTRVTPAKSAKVTAVAPATGGGVALAAMTESALEGLTVIPLTLFFLIGGPPLLARMGTALSGGDSSGSAVRLTLAIRSEVGRYFGTVALINLGLGAATAACLAALGMPDPILWGVLAGVLNFIPYLGPIATLVILSAAAFVAFDALGRALAVPAVFAALHLLESQFVEPLAIGRRLELNALVILLAVWFGFWFWGVAGVLLAVPSLVALKVAAEHKPSWSRVLDFLAPNEK